MLLKCVLLVLFAAGFVTPKSIGASPMFSDTYLASGIIRLPYAEIEEPIQAWYDKPGQRSRVDYYDGMVKTYRYANVSQFGLSLKVAPMTNETVTNAITCLALNGTTDSPVTAQSIFPDLSNFSYANDEVINGVSCAKWVMIDIEVGKSNKYSFWISNEESRRPVRYEMFGYDTLLKSHYDKYIIDYTNYDPSVPEDADFELQEGVMCQDISDVPTVHVHNPVKEFVDKYDNHVHALFNDFKDTHSKSYESEHEHEMRKNVFRHNLRFVLSTNRKALKFQVGINHLADMTDAEFRMLGGRKPSDKSNGGKPFNKEKYKNFKVADTLDWRLYGAVTPVKDQAICGCCWAFSAVGTIEGSLFLKTGQLLRLSEQTLVDCSWGYGNTGCDGGNDFLAYQWIMKHGGLPSSDEYGQYIGQDGYCHEINTTKYAPISGFVNIAEGDIAGLKLAVATQGPISVSIYSAVKEFRFYSNGVFYNADCKNNADDLNHMVLVVGYGTLDGEDYWLIKNSWSTYWGNDGYMLVSQTDNNCGIATSATFTTLA